MSSLSRTYHILLITDAWHPQVNGVVRTLTELCRELKELGHQVSVIEPSLFKTWGLPTYREIRLALLPQRQVNRMIDLMKPDAIHLVTEGPLGHAGRRYCLEKKIPYTTAYHTCFPEYIRARLPIPTSYSYIYLRHFHRNAHAVLVPTLSIIRLLEQKGFQNLHLWTCGVDTELFYPRGKSFITDIRPITLYVGRVAVEKNLEVFLNLDIPGTKYVVGDGPQASVLQRRYPEVRFVGLKYGEELAQYYAASDVLVFPSKTETFGIVMLEALACGVPVAAFPAPGPRDILYGHEVGCLDNNLEHAIQQALLIPSERCRTFAQQFSWHKVACQFIDRLAPI